jgi:glyoxylase-like metal-dependent hydrolase (beta-lactamase superfamily II)
VREILPGVYHWTAIHPRIGIEVSSYWLEDGGVLIDPLIPPDVGLEWFADRSTPPTAIVLSNRHHYRSSGELVERFDVPVLVPRSGLHEFTDRGPVTAYDPGDELTGGVRVYEIGGLCPDDMALYIARAGALAFADGLVRGSGEDTELGFVPDSLMDDPPGTKRALLDAFSRALSELEFEHVLLAHGHPLIGDGCGRLQEFVDAGGRTAAEL